MMTAFIYKIYPNVKCGILMIFDRVFMYDLLCDETEDISFF